MLIPRTIRRNPEKNLGWVLNSTRESRNQFTTEVLRANNKVKFDGFEDGIVFMAYENKGIDVLEQLLVDGYEKNIRK